MKGSCWKRCFDQASLTSQESFDASQDLFRELPEQKSLSKVKNKKDETQRKLDEFLQSRGVLLSNGTSSRETSRQHFVKSGSGFVNVKKRSTLHTKEIQRKLHDFLESRKNISIDVTSPDHPLVEVVEDSELRNADFGDECVGGLFTDEVRTPNREAFWSSAFKSAAGENQERLNSKISSNFPNSTDLNPKKVHGLKELPSELSSLPSKKCCMQVDLNALATLYKDLHLDNMQCLQSGSSKSLLNLFKENGVSSISHLSGCKDLPVECDFREDRVSCAGIANTETCTDYDPYQAEASLESSILRHFQQRRVSVESSRGSTDTYYTCQSELDACCSDEGRDGQDKQKNSELLAEPLVKPDFAKSEEVNLALTLSNVNLSNCAQQQCCSRLSLSTICNLHVPNIGPVSAGGDCSNKIEEIYDTQHHYEPSLLPLYDTTVSSLTPGGSFSGRSKKTVLKNINTSALLSYIDSILKNNTHRCFHEYLDSSVDILLENADRSDIFPTHFFPSRNNCEYSAITSIDIDPEQEVATEIVSPVIDQSSERSSLVSVTSIDSLDSQATETYDWSTYETSGNEEKCEQTSDETSSSLPPTNCSTDACGHADKVLPDEIQQKDDDVCPSHSFRQSSDCCIAGAVKSQATTKSRSSLYIQKIQKVLEQFFKKKRDFHIDVTSPNHPLVGVPTESPEKEIPGSQFCAAEKGCEKHDDTIEFSDKIKKHTREASWCSSSKFVEEPKGDSSSNSFLTCDTQILEPNLFEAALHGFSLGSQRKSDSFNVRNSSRCLNFADLEIQDAKCFEVAPGDLSDNKDSGDFHKGRLSKNQSYASQSHWIHPLEQSTSDSSSVTTQEKNADTDLEVELVHMYKEPLSEFATRTCSRNITVSIPSKSTSNSTYEIEILEGSSSISTSDSGEKVLDSSMSYSTEGADFPGECNDVEHGSSYPEKRVHCDPLLAKKGGNYQRQSSGGISCTSTETYFTCQSEPDMILENEVPSEYCLNEDANSFLLLSDIEERKEESFPDHKEMVLPGSSKIPSGLSNSFWVSPGKLAHAFSNVTLSESAGIHGCERTQFCSQWQPPVFLPVLDSDLITSDESYLNRTETKLSCNPDCLNSTEVAGAGSDLISSDESYNFRTKKLPECHPVLGLNLDKDCSVILPNENCPGAVREQFSRLQQTAKWFNKISQNNNNLNDRNENSTRLGSFCQSSGGLTTNNSNKNHVSMASNSSDNSVIECVYKDPEEGISFIERRIPSVCSHSSARSSLDSFTSVHSVDSQATEIYDWISYKDADKQRNLLRSQQYLSNEEIKQSLEDYGLAPGPVNSSTRQTYLNYLFRLQNNQVVLQLTPHIPEYTPELLSGLRDELNLSEIPRFEREMIESFQTPMKTRKWREGNIKSSFNYLLLDPRVTKNLPCRALIGEKETFQNFVAAIFYIGKGKRARPYAHLYEALSQTHKPNAKMSPKVKHILDIWGTGFGVVSLHCFQGVIPVEAYTREACMVEAMGLPRLTNKKRGDYYGVVSNWSLKLKRKLGVYFLKRALQIFLGEGERQICPIDLH